MKIKYCLAYKTKTDFPDAEPFRRRHCVARNAAASAQLEARETEPMGANQS